MQLGVPAGPEIWAYHAYWMRDAWRVYDLRAFARLIFFDLVAAHDGRIAERHGWPEEWLAFRQAARAAGVSVDPAVTVLGKPAFSAIFGSASARKRLLAETAALAREAGGVHLDVEVYETVEPSTLAHFHTFVAELRVALDAPPRRILTAFVPPGELYGAAELRAFDAVVAQGYDAHWQNGPSSGPVALLSGDLPAWRPTAEKLLREGVERSRILLSTPLYGYEWPTTSDAPGAPTRGPGGILTLAPLPPSLLPDLRTSALARAAQHGLRREPASGAPWYAFRAEDGWRQGWFDDPTSLAPRLEFVAAERLRGVALFVLGYDGGMLLETAQSVFRARSEAEGGAPQRRAP
jgi:spore germination protein YaaH